MNGPETPGRLEPMLLGDVTPAISDGLAALAAAATDLSGKLNPTVARQARDLVRVMNCYYSNLIEGHHTRPRDIARAIEGEFSQDQAVRNLQLEARAHIRLQAEIDEQARTGMLPDPAGQPFIRHLHAAFYAELPDSMRLIQGDGIQFMMEPGAFRSLPVHDNAVGRHLPPSSSRVAAFMDRFSEVYAADRIRGHALMRAVPAAHHRFAYIHPFPDGNGRVARLMSHAMILKAGYGAHGLWSISRGLARRLPGRPSYKEMLALADSPRRGSLDGRGNLSLAALREWTEWFIDVCVDQVRFMADLFDLSALTARLDGIVQGDRKLDPAAANLLRQVLVRGEIPRGEASMVTGLKERTARHNLSRLVQMGLLASDTPKGPVRLAFPLDYHEAMFPRLFAG